MCDCVVRGSRIIDLERGCRESGADFGARWRRGGMRRRVCWGQMTEHGVTIPAGASVRAERKNAAAPAAEAQDVAVVVRHVDSHEAVAAGRRRECDAVREG